MDIIEQNNLIDDGKRHPWELARYKIISRLISHYIPVSHEIKTILDIGCGDCYFALRLLNERNDIKIIGVDNAYSQKDLENKLNTINNPNFDLVASLNSIADKNQQIDGILLLDVIEHIEDDESFLESLSNSRFCKLKPIIFISVPAHQSLFTEHDIFLKHFRRYSLKSLKHNLTNAGFKPLRANYFFFSLLPFRLKQKLFEKLGLKAKQKGIGQWNKPHIITKFYVKCLLFDYKFSDLLTRTGLKLPGLSIYCICKKSAL